MPRALKTFITTLGFFELAVAAPTMKAALQAWGLERNAFKHGFARQTDDPKIIAAAEAKPGSVLRRPIGSKDEFKEGSRLPKASAAKAAAPLPKVAKPAKRPASREDKAKADASVIRLDAVRRAREEQQAKERARAEARAEAEAERGRAQRERAIEKAVEALSNARARHADAIADIDRQRAALDAQEEKENRRWENERKRLESALADAKNI